MSLPKITAGRVASTDALNAIACASALPSIWVTYGTRLRPANSAMRRISRCDSSPIRTRELSPVSRCRRRRAARTVMMMSDISGTFAISASIATRGTRMTLVSCAARNAIDQLPPARKDISAMNWVGPRADGNSRSSVKAFRISISPSST